MFTETDISKQKRWTENVMRIFFLVMTSLMIPPAASHYRLSSLQGITGSLFGVPIHEPEGQHACGRIWAPFLGTIYLVVVSLLVSAPIGVFAAVYLNEYARESWFTRITHLAVVNLAGVPSIVHALFGVGAFVLFAGLGESILAASLTLAIMTLPVIIASTTEALKAVPMSFREACWNLGTTRWQTIRLLYLPNSISGILTGVILQVSRAAGETAPIMFTGAVFIKILQRETFRLQYNRTVHGTLATPLYDFNTGSGRCGRRSVRDCSCPCRQCLTRQCSSDCAKGVSPNSEKVVSKTNS